MTCQSHEIAELVGAQSSHIFVDLEIDHISIDSRSLANNSKTLFFAIQGTHHDGHQFIENLIARGVQNFVVQKLPTYIKEHVNFFIVNDAIHALQLFAIKYRQKFNFPIIGITGSNGKTVVKEWLNFLLSPDYNIARSPKSYNSQVGVPLSVLTMNANHNLAIFEAGISTVGEMQNLQQIIKPTIGILTNIGNAHDEGFQDISQKIKEKLKLFATVSVLIYNQNKTIQSFLDKNIRTFTWSSTDRTANVYMQRSTINGQSDLKIKFENTVFDIKIPFTDDAAIENSMQCVAAMLYLKYDFAVIQNRVAQLFPIEMRLQVKTGSNNTTLIDDSYSADFQSLKIALDFLENQNQFKKKTIILSDIYQSGLEQEALYVRVSQLVLANKVSRVLVIGKQIAAFQGKFPNCKSFVDTTEFLQKLSTMQFSNETILIKGARSFGFERIVAALEQKNHETVLEINLNAVSHNLNYYRSKLNKNVKLMVMVKAFGYGNGGIEIAQLLQHHNIDYLGVAFADEGVLLRQAGILTPIMVLNPESSSFLSIVKHGLEPEIYSIKGLRSFLKIAADQNLEQYPVHIKLDTGMHRLGFELEQLPELISVLKQTNVVAVKSILSHMATSDNLDDQSFAKSQIANFTEMSDILCDGLHIEPILHLLNSSGISNFPEAQFDMVRLGIGLYGISNSALEQPFLENVGTLKSVISQTRSIPAGDSVGYGRKFVASKATKVATIPIGYADGVSRLWGNERGFVTINKQKATILGSICMDMLMADVSDIDCREGDVVIVFGQSPTVQEIATATQTISYEVLVNVSQRVKRIYYRE